MSTAQVVNTGIVSSAAARMPLRASGSSTGFQSVDALEGSMPSRARDQYMRFDDDNDDFDTSRSRRRPSGQFRDQVVSYGGVLVSREVGATIMQAQIASSKVTSSPAAAEAERGIAVYEFNQALMGNPEVTTNIGLRR
jgi:hypothetical protein